MPPQSRPTAALQALLVSALWSTSFLLIRFSLPFVPPITLAAVRYFLAFLMLLAYALLLDRRRPVRLAWVTLALIGILQYGGGQALQYSAMRILPVATIALTFSLLPALQAVADTIWLREPPRPVQLVGAAVTFGGIALYLPWGGHIAWTGLALMAGTIIMSTIATTFTRHVAREGSVSTLHLTLVSTGVGALFILPVGLLNEPTPRFPFIVIGALLWLALVNTAVAFSLWNHVLRTLTAFEANMIANTTLFQVGVLGWIFLGEPLTGLQMFGMLMAFGGVVLSQVPGLRAGRPSGPPAITST